MTITHRRRRERARRRQCILDAAQRVFAKHGLAAATMDHVAAEAELSKGTLYLYFRSKDDLFFELAAEVIDKAYDGMREADQPGKSGLEVLREALERYARVGFEHPNTIRNALIWIAGAELVDSESESFCAYRERVDRNQALMIEFLQRGAKDGSIRADIDPAVTIVQLWSGVMTSVVMTLNLQFLEQRLPRPIDASAITPGLIDLMLRGLATNPDQAT